VNRAEVKATLARAYKYIDDTQISEDVPERAKFFRHISKGGWPFSTKDHGWPISDCTAEGLKAALAIRHSGVKPAGGFISDERLYDAVEVILSFQNGDGGWATYELNRGWDWYEWFNPAEVFGDIMIDYTYVECTSACVTALAAFAKDFPNHRTREVQRSILAGADFIRNYQRPDGTGSACQYFARWCQYLALCGEQAGFTASGLFALHTALGLAWRACWPRERCVIWLEISLFVWVCMILK
jgi:cycloartenol synthase